jgi:hypothetical protein
LHRRRCRRWRRRRWRKWRDNFHRCCLVSARFLGFLLLLRRGHVNNLNDIVLVLILVHSVYGKAAWNRFQGRLFHFYNLFLLLGGFGGFGG